MATPPRFKRLPPLDPPPGPRSPATLLRESPPLRAAAAAAVAAETSPTRGEMRTSTSSPMMRSSSSAAAALTRRAEDAELLLLQAEEAVLEAEEVAAAAEECAEEAVGKYLSESRARAALEAELNDTRDALERALLDAEEAMDDTPIALSMSEDREAALLKTIQDANRRRDAAEDDAAAARADAAATREELAAARFAIEASERARSRARERLRKLRGGGWKTPLAASIAAAKTPNDAHRGAAIASVAREVSALGKKKKKEEEEEEEEEEEDEFDADAIELTVMHAEEVQDLVTQLADARVDAAKALGAANAAKREASASAKARDDADARAADATAERDDLLRALSELEIREKRTTKTKRNQRNLPPNPDHQNPDTPRDTDERRGAWRETQALAAGRLAASSVRVALEGLDALERRVDDAHGVASRAIDVATRLCDVVNVMSTYTHAWDGVGGGGDVTTRADAISFAAVERSVRRAHAARERAIKALVAELGRGMRRENKLTHKVKALRTTTAVYSLERDGLMQPRARTPKKTPTPSPKTSPVGVGAQVQTTVSIATGPPPSGASPIKARRRISLGGGGGGVRASTASTASVAASSEGTREEIIMTPSPVSRVARESLNLPRDPADRSRRIEIASPVMAYIRGDGGSAAGLRKGGVQRTTPPPKRGYHPVRGYDRKKKGAYLYESRRVFAPP